MFAVGNLFFYAECGFFKFDAYVFAQIGATLCASTSARTASAEEIAKPEELTKDVAKILEDRCVESATSRGVAYSGVTEAVVHFALLCVREHGIGLAALLKLFFRIRVVRIAVGVVLQRKLAIGALYLLISGPTLHAQNFVVISLYAWQFTPLAVSYESRAASNTQITICRVAVFARCSRFVAQTLNLFQLALLP